MTKYQNISKSEAVRHGSVAPRRLRSKKEEQEFGLSPREFVICPDCKSIFFDKAWHHNLDEDAKHIKENKNIKFSLCPACKMKAGKIFEGELTIKLIGVSPEKKQEILNIIKNSGSQAQDEDPMDRVLWLEETPGEIRVYTSENQLAVKIGKKLKSAFGGGNLNIKHSHEEDVIRVIWSR